MWCEVSLSCIGLASDVVCSAQFRIFSALEETAEHYNEDNVDHTCSDTAPPIIGPKSKPLLKIGQFTKPDT